MLMRIKPTILALMSGIQVVLLAILTPFLIMMSYVVLNVILFTFINLFSLMDHSDNSVV